MAISVILLSFFAVRNMDRTRAARAFYTSVNRGDAEGVRGWIDQVDVNETWNDEWNGYGTSSLNLAATGGNDEIVQLLLDHGAKLDVQDSRSGLTALMAAAFAGHVSTVRLLLQRGANLKTKDARGNTALTGTIVYHRTTIKNRDHKKAQGYAEIIEALRRAEGKSSAGRTGYQTGPSPQRRAKRIVPPRAASPSRG